MYGFPFITPGVVKSARGMRAVDSTVVGWNRIGRGRMGWEQG